MYAGMASDTELSAVISSILVSLLQLNWWLIYWMPPATFPGDNDAGVNPDRGAATYTNNQAEVDAQFPGAGLEYENAKMDHFNVSFESLEKNWKSLACGTNSHNLACSLTRDPARKARMESLAAKRGCNQQVCPCP